MELLSKHATPHLSVAVATLAHTKHSDRQTEEQTDAIMAQIQMLRLCCPDSCYMLTCHVQLMTLADVTNVPQLTPLT